MKAITYVSDALIEFSEDDLYELESSAVLRNEHSGITGYLCFHEKRFFQYIEGENKIVTDLMRSISRDKRHKIIRELNDPEIEERKFPGWHMRCLNNNTCPQINLEQIFIDHFLFVGEEISSDERWINLTWEMVNKIAGLQHKLIVTPRE